VPNDPDYATRMHFTVSIQSGTVLLVSNRSKTGRLGYPFTLEPDSCTQQVVIKQEDLGDVSVSLDKIAAENSFRLCLQLHRSKDPFCVWGAMRAGGARVNYTRTRIRRAVSRAGPQLKRGLRFREAPTVVFIYQAGLSVAKDSQIQSALFGDLTYGFDPCDFQNDEYLFAGNALWHPSKHRSISAVVYFPNNDPPTTVHNPWATHRLPTGLFGGREYVVQSDGTLKLIEDTMTSN